MRRRNAIPFSFALSVLALFALGIGEAQTVAPLPQSSRTPRRISSNEWMPEVRNPLQADPRTVAIFLRPWLFTSVSARSAIADSSFQPKSYKLTPDPLNWTEPQDPDEDNWAYLPELPHLHHANTAERLATSGARESGTKKKRFEASGKYSLSRIGDREVGAGINFYSIEKEVALGRQLSLQVEQSSRLLTDPVINEYVNRTGQSLVRHSDCKVAFNIKVIDDDEVNAFALPGGFFYVNSGLILAADNEAELAGVMAHEIAHVCARHATRNVTKAQIAQFASLPLLFIGGPIGFAAQQISGIAMPLSLLKFGRDAEREADLLGIQYQYAAGYDPTAFVDFFEKLEEEEKEPHNFVARAFATHPMTSERVRQAEGMLESLPDRNAYITDTSEFDAVRGRLAEITRGRAVSGGSRPRPTLRRRTAGKAQ